MASSRFLFGTVTLAMLNASVAWAITGGWSYMHPKLATGEVEVHRVCLMPAEGRLSKLGMKGGEGMFKESEAWSSVLQTVVESHLKEVGVEIVPGGMSPQDLEKNEELQQTVLKLQSKYNSISTQLDKHPKDTRKARFTVGDEVALLPCTTNADTLVYVHGEGQVLTGGKKAFGVLVFGATNSMAYLTLSLVDAKSGDILAYLRLVNNGKFVSDSEKAYGSKLNKMFKQMKIGTTGKKGKKGKA
jgi:hypothetical protein